MLLYIKEILKNVFCKRTPLVCTKNDRFPSYLLCDSLQEKNDMTYLSLKSCKPHFFHFAVGETADDDK